MRTKGNSKRISQDRGLFLPIFLIAILGSLVLTPLMFGRGAVKAADESISTFATDCTTPKSTWNLGETACATATNSPNDRRIAWVAPDGTVAQITNFYSGTLSDSYTIKTGTDRLAQVGTWTVQTVDPSGNTFATANFVVKDPNNASVDLQVGNYGPFQIAAGNNINYLIDVTNKGPDDAQNVALTIPVPGGTTFFSEAQTSGPSFSCTTPSVGSGSGTISCTIATLPANGTATFSLAVAVNGAATGTVITSTASISSSTNEIHQADNSASTSTTVVSATTACTVNCPTVTPVTTTSCSAVVTYGNPTTSGSCGSSSEGGGGVVCSPPSGSSFPVGNTAVTCTAATGDSCSFTVTVQFNGASTALTISCPSDVTANSDTVSGGTATVTYPSPTTTGNCVTVVCTPPSGSVFSLGTTAVTCTAQDASNSTQTCSFNVTVNNASSGGCSLTCPGDITQSAASGQCSATVAFASPTTTGTCSGVTCKDQDNNVRHSGDSFPAGTTIITCSSAEGATCSFTITVIAADPPTITTCASNKTVSVNSNCQAAIPNLVGPNPPTQVVTTGCSVVLSQSPTAGTIVGPGTYTVTVTAENSAGAVSCTATVTAVDTTPPVITTCPSPTSASADANCQAAVPSVVGGVVATDNCTDAASLTVSQSPGAGTLVTKGVTTITITVKDAANNSSTCTTTFTVNDTTPPTITCPANMTVYLPLNSTATSMVVNFTVTATDNCPGVTVTSTPASGSVFSVGTTTVNSAATDTSGNTASCSFTVTVLYDFTGFFSPVGNPPTLNVVNAGRAVPVKFSLSGNKGLNIFAAGYPVSGSIACDLSAPPNDVTETVTAGSSSLSYDATSDQYVYVWATDSAWAGTCRQLQVKLNDGSVHVANFKFR